MSVPASSSAPPLPTVDFTTFLSLLAVLFLLVAAYCASLYLLPATTTRKLRLLYIWHAFDFLIHTFFEGSFLYHCFFSYSAVLAPEIAGDYPHPASRQLLAHDGIAFLGHKDRRYGSLYGVGPTAKLWQEYAKADKRWGGADLTVVSLELLTVFGAGPVAACVCEMIRRGDGAGNGKMWFWASVLATAELYGGFMTFAPEWLSKSPNLDTSNFLYLWVYLVFFNTLWVWFPLWVLYEAYHKITWTFQNAMQMKSINQKKIS